MHSWEPFWTFLGNNREPQPAEGSQYLTKKVAQRNGNKQAVQHYWKKQALQHWCSSWLQNVVQQIFSSKKAKLLKFCFSAKMLHDDDGHDVDDDNDAQHDDDHDVSQHNPD